MSFKTKLAAAALGVLAIGGIAAGSIPSAQAATFKCIFSNGCGVLTGVDNAVPAHAVSVDAKYQDFTEMAIGYPNLVGDSATNVSLVGHTSPGHLSGPHPHGLVFYTLVGAKAGSWSNQCLTAQGDGKLRFAVCTLGRDSGQRFYAYHLGHAAGLPDVVSTNPGWHYAFKNLATHRFLEDASTSNPLVHQTDVSDAVSPTGRQLDANGMNSTSANELWVWGPGGA